MLDRPYLTARDGQRVVAFIAALLAGCAVAAPRSMPVIATLPAGAEAKDPAALVNEIVRRTGVRIVFGSALSDRVLAITVLCETTDPDCNQARATLLASGMFVDISPDLKRRRQ